MFHANVKTKTPTLSYVTDIDKFLIVIYIIILSGFLTTMMGIALRRKWHRPATARKVVKYAGALIVPESILLLAYYAPTHSTDPTQKPFSAVWLTMLPFVGIALIVAKKALCEQSFFRK